MSLLPARIKKIQFKIKALECSQDFSHYKSMGIFPNAQGQLTPQSMVGSGQIWNLSKTFWLSSLHAKNIAKSEQSSHTPGGSHHRPYHFTQLERKKNGQIKGLISNMWLNFLYTVQLVISDVCKILGQVVLEKSLTKISIFITLEIEKRKNRKRRQK